jgi:hypothetical protein
LPDRLEIADIQASDIQAAIKGLMDGTLRPEDVKINGIDTDEEKQKKEVR